jgi:sodium-dependent dicarboxylate transporter 2/3/5
MLFHRNATKRYRACPICPVPCSPFPFSSAPSTPLPLPFPGYWLLATDSCYITRVMSNIEIDRRPIWKIISSRILRPLLLILLGFLVSRAIYFTPPEGMTVPAMRASIVFAVCLFLWISEWVPPAATGLFAIAALPLFGVTGREETFALFGSEPIFFMLGGFFLAAAMLRTGLSSRMALWGLQRVGQTPMRLLLGIHLIGLFFSMVMPANAVVAMLLPLILEISRALQGKSAKIPMYVSGLFLALLYGTRIGSIATFLGSPRTPMTLALLQKLAPESRSIGFLDWMMLSFPMVAVMAFISFLLIRWWIPIDIESTKPAQEALWKTNRDLGKVSYAEAATAFIVVATVFAWMAFGRDQGLANIAIAASVSLFVFGILSWKDAEREVSWGVIFMFGGALCVGSALQKTGAAAWASERLLAPLADNPLLLLAVLSLLVKVFSEVISNNAVVAIMIPLALSMGSPSGLDPVAIALSIALPAGLIFALPAGTPSTALIFGSGFLRTTQVLKPGLLLGLFTWLTLLALAFFYWPLFGLTPTLW